MLDAASIDRLRQGVNRSKEDRNHNSMVWTDDAALLLTEHDRLTGVLKEARATAFERAAYTGSNAWSDLYLFLNAALDTDEEGQTLPLPKVALARGEDPITSHLAAASIDDLPDRHYAVWFVLDFYGHMTDEELVDEFDAMRDRFSLPIGPQTGQSLRSRRKELVRGGKVRWNGQYRKNRSGRKAQVWEAV